MNTNEVKALDPVWFRFTDDGDQGKYGSQWVVYDEGSLMRMDARALIALEDLIGMPVVKMMNGFRAESTAGNLAAVWLSLHLLDPGRAGEYDAFDCKINMIEWTGVEPVGKDEPQPEPDGVPGTAGNYDLSTSVQTDTVALPSMPVTGSGI